MYDSLLQQRLPPGRCLNIKREVEWVAAVRIAMDHTCPQYGQEHNEHGLSAKMKS